jgi:predicted DsbA family dithiol-disulfide isomerase
MRVGVVDVAAEVISCEVFFDYLCPFVYRMAVLLDAVRTTGERPLEIEWRYFSLTQVNSKEEGWTVWDAPASTPVKGRAAFQAAEAARRQGKFEALHMPLLQARHRDRLDIDSREVVDHVAEQAGLDLARFRRDLGDPALLLALARDHREAVEVRGIFGTPTLVFANGAAAYVRLAEQADPAGAVEVFDRVFSVASQEPRILEIKRPVKAVPAHH